jgi:hypothetical protein
VFHIHAVLCKGDRQKAVVGGRAFTGAHERLIAVCHQTQTVLTQLPTDCYYNTDFFTKLSISIVRTL